MIRYCTHTEIDRPLWDGCVARSFPGLPYAFSYYLDIISPGWDGLVSGDYEAVMPLPFKKKWGITYIFKPYYAQQLGVFSAETLPDAAVSDFIRSIPVKFRFIHTNLNEKNALHRGMTASHNANHLIRTDRDYDDICKGYSRNCRRNIKKAAEAGLTIEPMNDDRAFVRFVFENLGRRIRRLDREQSDMLEKIVALSREKCEGEVTAVYTAQHSLCAAGFFMQTHERMVFSVCASSDEGKAHDAMYLLVNDQVKKTANTKTWFDFSGSNLPGIAYFNQSFGALTMTYPTLHLNRLPLPLRLIKK